MWLELTAKDNQTIPKARSRLYSRQKNMLTTKSESGILTFVSMISVLLARLKSI